ncbi:ATP-binding protein [soil metagenome]
MNTNLSEVFSSRIALITAGPGCIVAFLIIYGLLYFTSDLSWHHNIVYAIAGSFLMGLFLFGWILYLYRQRIETLHQIAKNITGKIFEEYNNVDIRSRDELDTLTKRLIIASKTVEKELVRLNKIENYRKEFIGDISHELKTPIFAIQGFIETLLNGALEDPEVNEIFLQKAMKNVNRLTYLTKDLMEISRLETGELKSTMQEIYLHDLVLDVAEHLQYKSQKENVTIYVEPFEKNLKIRADRSQIKQVLINLVENAVKYNIHGGRVEISIKPLIKNSDKVRLYVKDTGIGIDPKDIPRVTERFFRVDKSRSRERGGTGLGLSIVKHIIEAHGESMSIESGKEGSTFSFTLSKVN